MPNSVGGRIPVGYWDDTATRGESSLVNAIDTEWDVQEKEMVVNYLRRAFSSSADDDSENELPTIVKVWRGFVTCRLCDDILGNTCHGDFKYNWPEGYLHYVKKHNVKPSQHFIDHVRKQTAIIAR